MVVILYEIASDIWPIIFICSFILIILRVAYIVKNNIKIVLYNEIVTLLFVIYFIILFYVVTFQDIDVPILGYNIIPFKEIFRYPIGSRLFIKNVLGNMVMFIPFGLFVSFILKKIHLIWVIIITLIISIAIEFIQIKIGRIFDIDDIILNIIGSIIGYYMYSLEFSLRKKIDFNR